MADQKRMSVKEFREGGFLQEVNRLFFHPLGLALAVDVDNPDETTMKVFIIDSREDPEGFIFGETDGIPFEEGLDAYTKSMTVAKGRIEKMKTRMDGLGYVIQELDVEKLEQRHGKKAVDAVAAIIHHV